MTRTFVQRGALLFAAVIGLIGSAPRSASAQKALVYCPVNVDATGCTTIVNALTGPTYPLGVDKGYDGTNGTVDLKTVDLFAYSVFVVPSLADGASSQPYAKLRDPEVQEHLKAALIGRIAMWSGTPDQGATNRAAKDALIQNLVGWAGGAYATAKGPGLVALLDASASVVTRYDWVRAIAPLPVTSDANLLIYNSVRSLNQRATSILTSGAGAIVYDNMATFGFQVPNGAAGVSLDAVGQTGTSVGGQVVLLTMEAGNASGATVKTDKDDYAPGTTVVITGAGWAPGETVKLTLHHDPMRDDDTELTAVADGRGNIANTDFAPANYDIDVRFVLTAVGQTSGRRAQATFTDANPQSITTTGQSPNPVLAGNQATFPLTLVVGGNNNSCTVTFSATPTGSPAWPAAPPGGFFTFSSPSVTTTGTDQTTTLTVSTTAGFTANTTYHFTVSGTSSGSGCQGPGAVPFAGDLVIGGAANSAPILGAIGNKSVNETALLQFTATATDANSPSQTLTYSLDAGAPAGATINSSTGQFSWTPTESQGGATYPVTIRVTDNGSPAANDSKTFNITVNEVNLAPTLNAIGTQSVNELSTLTFTATASDTDIPANSLTFSLAAGTNPVPSGATINPTSGAFSWTTTEADGPGTYKFKVVVTDNGTPALADEEEITVTVNEVNVAPTLLNVPATATIPEGVLYSFDANASDTDTPAQTLTFSLESAPVGATIDPATGVFSWTPSESQGPGAHTFKVKVTDGTATTEASVTLTVTEANVAPVLNAIGSQNVNELATLSFTATASDADLPANSLTFSLAAGTNPVPTGAAINPSTGAFSWTPTEDQGPGTYKFKVVVTDNGTPNLADEEEITVTVAEVNVAPSLTDVPASATIPEIAPFTFDANASDTDTPAQTLTFSLDGAPSGAAIDPATGVFTWTPSEAQGPNAYTFKVKVSDGITATESSITLTVTEVNVAPVLEAIGGKTVDENALLSFNAAATDADLPANGLTFTLIGAPAGATITAAGAFSWTPTEAQGPGSYTFTVKVTDNGSPVLSDEEEITVTVNEVNVLPTLTDVPPSATIPENALYTFDANATDTDLPAQTLTFSLVGAPAGASIDGSTGAFSWTPSEAQGPGPYTFKVRVNDGIGNTESSITLTVTEVNVAPVLTAIGSKTIDEVTPLTFTATATDADLPANGLTFSLIGAPAGASITAAGGFSWTPTEAQGPGSYTFTVKVTDDGSPTLSDEEEITVTVNEVNVAPVLDPIGPKSLDEKTLLTFTATASDADVPTNSLTFSLVAGSDPVPGGANITSAGVFTWTPTEAQGPGTYKFKVRVTDNGTPVLFDEEEITVTVNEVNEPPVLAAIGNKNVNEETLLTFTASATDTDVPANSLTYSLVGAPVGAAIDASSGVFTWTPTEAQGAGTYTFTVKVTDNGTPAASDEESITVTVAEVNKMPTVAPIGPKTVNEGVALSFTATATDPDVPANSLTFSLVSGAPATATIDPVTGAFSWTPPNGPATVNITVRATDNGSPALYDDETFTVTVNNVAPTATFTAPAGPLNEGQPIVVSFSNPMDVPADLGAITYAYDCGTGYGAATTSVTATCSAKDNPNQVVKGKVIDHTGDFTEYTRTILVDNVAPVLGAMTISPNAVIQVNTTITASAPFTDAGVNDTHTGTFVWDDATANTSAGITEMNGSGTASATHKYTAPGVYEVVLTLRDKDGAEVGTTYQYVVVYDPSGGFVTGGGWIDSPANACQLTPTCKPLTGKANFGFVSKYKKGQSTPEGNTEFQFKAGDINFHSEVYEWLVVAGARSQFKGTGTINGSGNYGFMLTAVDGQVSGGGGTDKFRIKIWDKNDGDRVVYDNQLLSADDAAPTTVLGGGSINIQAK